MLRDAQARANWYLSVEGPGAGPPLMHSLSMPAAHVELQDARGHLHFTGTLSVGDAQVSSGAPPLRLDTTGELNGRPVTLWIDGSVGYYLSVWSGS